jgi:hypothetical protein
LPGNTSVLTVDLLNEIVKRARPTSPIREHTSDLDLFNLKEERYRHGIKQFRNEDGSFTISQPIAMSLLLALETEQRSKNHFKLANEFHLTQMRTMVDSASFAVRIRDEVTANITKLIIDNRSKLSDRNALLYVLMLLSDGNSHSFMKFKDGFIVRATANKNSTRFTVSKQ